MNTLLHVLFNMVILFVIIFALLILFTGSLVSKGRLSLPKWLVKLINLLKIKYNQFTFKYFIKIQKYKSIILRHKIFLLFQELKSKLKRDLKEFHRKIKFFPLKFYNYINHHDIQFEINSFVTQLTAGKYIHIDIYNIYYLDHKDLFRVIYIKLMSDPKIFNKLDKCDLYLIGTSFRDLDTDLCKLFKIKPRLDIDKNSSFNEFYNSIFYRYLHNGYNTIEDLDNIYKL